MIRAGIVGASGYTGAELLRILCCHPSVEVAHVTAATYAGERVASLYPSLSGYTEAVFEEFDAAAVAAACDVAFVGLPHGESMKAVPALLDAGLKVVDLSADFRLERGSYEDWYGVEHCSPGLLETAVYGVPELYREELKSAVLVANPGCYPTSALLALYPLLRRLSTDGTVVVDAKSGVSGAGRDLSLATHYPQVSGSISPYAVSGHRHTPEIREQVARVSTSPARVVFVPHLAPMDRGILCTAYVPLSQAPGAAELAGMYDEDYGQERFVHVLPNGVYPCTKAVRGSNNCHVSVEPCGDGMVVAMSAIDNLVKGASGQAVQNMNLMFGFDEDAGLAGPGVFP